MLMLAGSMAAMKEVGARTAAPADGRTHLERVREANDALWRLNEYAFLACACGTTLKVPPAHRRTASDCPHCGQSHLPQESEDAGEKNPGRDDQRRAPHAVGKGTVHRENLSAVGNCGVHSFPWASIHGFGRCDLQEGKVPTTDSRW